ncbi:MAG: hypothetical protein J3Q66DRAFT_372995 [Benniella sp.]|nr:MAG: hypothetical protein J3Q66DRAFT_372995 [Benniella sp.]
MPLRHLAEVWFQLSRVKFSTHWFEPFNVRSCTAWKCISHVIHKQPDVGIYVGSIVLLINWILTHHHGISWVGASRPKASPARLGARGQCNPNLYQLCGAKNKGRLAPQGWIRSNTWNASSKELPAVSRCRTSSAIVGAYPLTEQVDDPEDERQSRQA